MISEVSTLHPEINGKLPTPESFYFDIYKDRKQEYDGPYEYKDLEIPIEFTGKIILGYGFLEKYYIHIGFQRAWSYEKLIELDIEEGIVVNVIDHSKKRRN